MKTYFFTFGANHTDWNGMHSPRSLGQYYTTISAFSRDQAIEIMQATRGQKWTFCYESAVAAGVQEFNLQHLPLQQLTLPPQ